MTAVRVPAKINWDLRVLGRRPDGFHELRSWFLTAEWCDELEAVPRAVTQGGAAGAPAGGAPAARPEDDSLEVLGPRAERVPVDGSNLVLRAARAWREAGGRAPALRFHLHKQLPHGAGLGGGSGDAAAALRLLQAHGAPLPAARLDAIALAVGSDVPYYLGSAAASLRGGRGERALAEAPVPEAWLAIAVPRVAVATASVFAVLAAPPYEPGVEGAAAGAGAAGTAPAGAGGPPPTLAGAPGPNDLVAAAEVAVPELARFRRALARLGRFHMSGSGGAHFAACPTREAAEALAARVRGMCEDVHVARLRREPPLHFEQGDPR